MAGLDEELVAAYAVNIEGVKRTRAALAALDKEVHLLRTSEYAKGAGTLSSVTKASGTKTGKRDIFTAEIDNLEGQIQKKVSVAMASGMAIGRKVQTQALRDATTKTGRSGKSHTSKGRRGPGRDDSGDMINQIKTNVETSRQVDSTQIVGWHGWEAARSGKIDAQERGSKGHGGGNAKGAVTRKKNKPKQRIAGTKSNANNKGVPAANSLGKTIPVVREHLKRELGKLK